MSMEDAPQRMLDVLARAGWHGYEEIAAACDVDPDESVVLAIYHRLIAQGYSTDVIQMEQGRGASRYRWEPHHRPE
jgi:hypothetical protein